MMAMLSPWWAQRTGRERWLTGVMLAFVPFNWQVHDTHFVVAHLHYVLVGGFVFPMMAAAYYWLPHITGRQPVQHLSKPAFWLVFIGFNVMEALLHVAIYAGVPRANHAIKIAKETFAQMEAAQK